MSNNSGGAPGAGLFSGGPQAPTSGNVGDTLRQVGDPLGLKGGNTFSSYAPGGRPSNGRPGRLADNFDPAGVEARAFQAANPVVNYGDPNGQMSAHGRWLQQQQAAQGITPPTQYAPNQYGTPGNVAPTPYGWTEQAWQQQQAINQQMSPQGPAGPMQGPGLAGAMATGNPAWQGPPPQQGGALGGYAPMQSAPAPQPGIMGSLAPLRPPPPPNARGRGSRYSFRP